MDDTEQAPAKERILAAAEELFGWTENEVRGNPLPLIPPDRVPIMEENNRKLSRGQQTLFLNLVAEILSADYFSGLVGTLICANRY